MGGRVSRGIAAGLALCSLALCSLAPGLGGCGCGDDAPAPPAPVLVGDAERLLALVAEDPASVSLAEVDEAVADDLPVRASGLLETGAIPAARRQLERAQAVQVGTEEGRALRREIVEIYEERVRVLERYRELLARGTVEDYDLVVALGEQRAVEVSLLDVMRRLEEVRPLQAPEERRPRVGGGRERR